MLWLKLGKWWLNFLTGDVMRRGFPKPLMGWPKFRQSSEQYAFHIKIITVMKNMLCQSMIVLSSYFTIWTWIAPVRCGHSKVFWNSQHSSTGTTKGSVRWLRAPSLPSYPWDCCHSTAGYLQLAGDSPPPPPLRLGDVNAVATTGMGGGVNLQHSLYILTVYG